VTYSTLYIYFCPFLLQVFNNKNTYIRPGGSSNPCTQAYGSGSQCRPNECIFESGKPRGVGILGRRVYEPGEGNGEVSLQATWERGGQILSQQGGFQVSRGGQKGEQRGKCLVHKSCSRSCI
jgi:hypothetical protein